MKNNKRKIKVFLFHNEISPYRSLLFEELSKKLDLKVFFGRRKTKWRRWDTTLDNFSFYYEILVHFDIGNYFFNYKLPFRLLAEEFDIYILAENARHFFSNFIVVFFAKIRRKPLIIWTEQVETKYLKHHYANSLLKRALFMAHWKLSGIYRRIIYYLADFFVAFCKKTKDYLIEIGIPDNKISSGIQVMPAQLMPNTTIKKSETKFKNKIVILYLGYLTKRKGIDILIEAYKKLDEKNISLIIAGSGEDETRLRYMAGKRNDIKFVGHTNGMDKANYYTIADIFVLPSFHDEWGLTVNEAMYYGLPVIITESIGAVEIVDKIKNGFIIKPNNVDELFSCLHILVSDRKLRKKMSDRSKNYKKTYLIENTLRPFIKAINNVYKEAH